MRARIYQPARNAMQSGNARNQGWVLEFIPADARRIDPLMGWTSSSDTQTQVRLHFDTVEAAMDYARAHGIDAVVRPAQPRKPNIRMGGYGENFATNRRGTWTH
ncbi:MAG: ETC complex I subunit [Paracoccaceae bacterium]